MRRPQPQELPHGCGEALLVRLVAPQQVDLGAAAPAGVLDDPGEQQRGRIAPAVRRHPSALVEAQTPGDLEAAHRGHHCVARDQLVNGELATRRSYSTGRREALVGGQEPRPRAPARGVQLPKGGKRGSHLVTAGHPVGGSLPAEPVGRLA